jgi:hypothetical protein
MIHKFLFPIALPTNSSDPAGTFDEGSIYYDNSLKTIKQYSLGSWQLLPDFSSLSGIPVPLLTTGLNVCPFSATATATTTLAMTNNTSYWIPFSVNRKTTVSALSVNVTTAATNSSETVGIYNSNLTNLYPNTLLGSVNLATASTGLKTGNLTTAITLTPGVYWIALASNGAPTLTALAVGSLKTLAYSSTTAVTHYRNTGTTLPATAPTSGYTAGTTAFPLVLMTISF